MKLSLIALTVFTLAFSQSVGAAPAGDGALDPDQPYTAKMGTSVTYDVSFDVVFTAPYGTKQAEVWLAVPTSDNAQQVEAYRTEPTAPSDQTEPLYNNRLVHFSYDKPQADKSSSRASK